ncbi:MAG TPA: hypothetical protein VGQ99_00940 [Tepidisphaeraceae bacterium]|nr:hypothetical protein [Tepidisphaeraceae bacterium]
MLLNVPSSSFLLHIYAARDDGYGTFPFTNLKLAINKSHAVLYDEQPVPNWLSGGSSFIGGMDATGPGGGGFIDINKAAISDISFFVSNSDQSVSNLGISNQPTMFGGANVYVFAAEAIFPEPGTDLAVALAAFLLGRRRR